MNVCESNKRTKKFIPVLLPYALPTADPPPNSKLPKSGLRVQIECKNFAFGHHRVSWEAGGHCLMLGREALFLPCSLARDPHTGPKSAANVLAKRTRVRTLWGGQERRPRTDGGRWTLRLQRCTSSLAGPNSQAKPASCKLAKQLAWQIFWH